MLVFGVPEALGVPSRAVTPLPLPSASTTAFAPMDASALLRSICSETAMPAAFWPTAIPPATEVALTSSLAETRTLPPACTARVPVM